MFGKVNFICASFWHFFSVYNLKHYKLLILIIKNYTYLQGYHKYNEKIRFIIRILENCVLNNIPVKYNCVLVKKINSNRIP